LKPFIAKGKKIEKMSRKRRGKIQGKNGARMGQEWVDLLHFRDSLTPSNETFGSISGSIGRISCLFWASFKSFD
jgi:hypothetical protein